MLPKLPKYCCYNNFKQMQEQNDWNFGDVS